MRSRIHDPLRLDLVACAAEGGDLPGQWPGSELARLAQCQSTPDDAPAPPVQWQARAEQRQAGGERQLWLHLRARTSAWLTCQRCLQPYEQRLDVDRRLRFVHDEATAEALDAESEDDVLALPRWLDLRELVEDELLLALPLVPRHVSCPQPLPASLPADARDARSDALTHPFSALEALKRPKRGDGGSGDG